MANMKILGKLCFLLCSWVVLSVSICNQVQAESPETISLASQIIDAKKSNAERDGLINANPGKAGELISAMTKDLPVGTPDEYKAIPWIWKVAIAAGKRNDARELKELLQASLPKEGEPLRDWQAVVIGGGVINGLSLQGIWPRERIAEIIGSEKKLKAQWLSLIELAAVMADNEKVRGGTRYDALRVLGTETWEHRGAQLAKYLEKGINAELQQGAVSGLADVKSKEVALSLIGAFKNLTSHNRKFALDALWRDDSRIAVLLDALGDGRIEVAALSTEQVKRLKNLPDEKLRGRAEQLLK